MTKDQLATGVQEALRLQEVPPEKFGAMLVRTATGIAIALVGVALLYVMGRLALSSAQPSVVLVITLLSAGGGFLVLGGHIVSGQIRRAVMELIPPLRAVRRAIKGNDESNGGVP